MTTMKKRVGTSLAIVLVAIWGWASLRDAIDAGKDHPTSTREELSDSNIRSIADSKFYGLDLAARLRSDQPDRFAGAYLDERGKLHINLIEGTRPADLNIDESVIAVHFVEYSYEQLMDVYEEAGRALGKLPVQSVVSLDERNNGVTIELHRDNRHLEREIRNAVDSPGIRFAFTELTLQLG